MRNVEADENVPPIQGRPDFSNHDFGVTLATKFPPYVFSVSKNALLVHRVVRVELHWYQANYEQLIRLKRPRSIALTACGCYRFLEAQRTRTCLVPNPDALLCGRCYGELATFGKHGAATKAGIKKRWANVQLGCVVQGY